MNRIGQRIDCHIIGRACVVDSNREGNRTARFFYTGRIGSFRHQNRRSAIQPHPVIRLVSDYCIEIPISIEVTQGNVEGFISTQDLSAVCKRTGTIVKPNLVTIIWIHAAVTNKSIQITIIIQISQRDRACNHAWQAVHYTEIPITIIQPDLVIISFVICDQGIKITISIQIT